MYNDDVAIIDFLADLQDKEPIKGLQRFVEYAKNQPVCLLYSCPIDDIYLVVLYKAPMDVNTGDNKLMLFAYDNLTALYHYFDKWIHETSNAESDNNIKGALSDILRVISHELQKIVEKNTLTNWMG